MSAARLLRSPPACAHRRIPPAPTHLLSPARSRPARFPISTFVAIGLEHSVANMFLLPLGLLGGADLSLADVFIKNVVPVTLGNAIAGALVVAAGYSYAFGKLGEED